MVKAVELRASSRDAHCYGSKKMREVTRHTGIVMNQLFSCRNPLKTRGTPLRRGYDGSLISVNAID